MPIKDAKKRKEYQHQWYLENRERVIERSKAHAREYRLDKHYLELEKERMRKYYLKNRDRILERNEAWRKENLERCAAYMRKSYAKNPEPSNARHRTWSRAHPEKVRLYHFRRRVGGSDKIDVGTLNDVFVHNVDKYGALTCIYCKVALENNKKVIDHLMPISRGGKNNYENLGVACFSCNAKKHAKTYDEFMEIHPFI